jgi:hypothetical protein
MTRKPNFVNPKKHHIPRTSLRVGLVAAALMFLMVVGFSSSAKYQPNSSMRIKVDNGLATSAAPHKANFFSSFLAAFLSPAKPQSANLDQIRNGSFDAPIADPNWVNGNAGATNAHYREGESIPYRLRLDNLTVGHHVVNIEWDTRHSGVNAIDFITYYDRLSDSDPDPLKGLAGNYGLPTPVPIPTPTNSPTSDYFDNLPEGQRTFTVYNATNVVLSYDHEDALTGAQSSTGLTIEFDTTVGNVLFAWGGHIASRLDWGSTNGVPNSAGGISGSPYHTRLLDLDGSGGNQDRSLSAAAVLPPAGCAGLPLSSAVCEGSQTSYTANGADPATSYTFTWTLTGDGTFDANGTQALVTNGVGSSTVDVDAGSVTSAGSYTLEVTISCSGCTDSTCSTIVTVNPNPEVSITSAGTGACANTPSLTATGAEAGDTISWTGPGIPSGTEDDATIFPTAAGTYTVQITRNGCSSNIASGALCFGSSFTPSP